MLKQLSIFISRHSHRLFKKKVKSEKISSEKLHIRQEVHSQKKKLLTEEFKKSQSEAVFAKIERMNDFIKAETVLMYWSLSDELPTHDFIRKWSQSKIILLPVVKEHHMSIRPFKSAEALEKGQLGVMQPGMSSQDYLAMADLVILPGVAFDRSKRRLGRGKGYYDRYLKKNKRPKWGIGFDFQLYENIPSASFDVKMDKIVTASEIIS